VRNGAPALYAGYVLDLDVLTGIHQLLPAHDRGNHR
jgi:hypothetical protein